MKIRPFEFFKDYGTILLTISLTVVILILQLSGVVEQNFSLPALVTSFIAFATSESIRFLLFRQKLDENFQRFTEAKIIGSASDFFHDLLAAFNNNATASAEVCYFTQQPPTDFYHLSHVKKYWEEMLVTLKKNKNKSLLRLVLLTNPAMFGWLEKHIEEHKGLSNYYLNVITEKEDHQFLSLCLTSNQECYIFSPHAPDQSPSYIWIKNEVIHHTLKTAYDRMWASGKRVLIQGRVNNDVINELRTQFMNISNNNFERKD